ncbi:MAG: hypothetical protein JWN71_229 [Xanthobacteraceae bacterium]|nr:hypothetical protein [Xanthobacteraceae bacterium]
MTDLSAYGKHLFDLLPEIYRERDRKLPAGKTDHLRDYLDSHGVLLDRVRNTLEQLYADHFADVPEQGRVCQSWIIPYLADLVGAAPVSPFADGQRDEVANAIRWSKRKGTRVAVEEIIETVAVSEAEMQEGWQRVIVTARPDDMILPATYFGQAPHPVDAILSDPDASKPFSSVNPQRAAQHPGIRAGTIDIRATSRAKLAPRGEIGASESRFGTALRLWPRDDNAPATARPEPTGWRQHEPHGAPCFPDSYEDISSRTLDTRMPDPAGRHGRYHPKSLIIFLPPPFGLCAPKPHEIDWPTEAQWANQNDPVQQLLERHKTGNAKKGFVITVRNKTSESVAIKTDLTVDQAGNVVLASNETLRLEKLRLGKLTLNAGHVQLERCAVGELAFGAVAGERLLTARSVLFGSITGGAGLVTLEYCTILDHMQATAKINASEVIFPDDTLANSIVCARFSRLPAAALDETPGRRRATNTDAKPLFVSSTFCQPGAGVLRPEASTALLGGAEDGTEIGAYHDWRYAALRSAIRIKLEDFLPMGIRPVIAWDGRLLCTPPKITFGP